VCNAPAKQKILLIGGYGWVVLNSLVISDAGSLVRK
jgi:hypothetical protein